MNLAAVKMCHSMAAVALFPAVAPPSSSSSSSLSTLRKLQILTTPKPQCLKWSQSPNPTGSSRRVKTTPGVLSGSGGATSVLPETLKSRLGNGETLYGIFLLSFSPTLAEIAGLSGYDFAVVDMEHGPGGISDALPCLRALAATNTAAILRVPETTAAWAKKALDLGPQGIMFPMIDTSEDARKAVSYCRFPPNGIRGSAHTVVRASGYGLDEGYLSNYEDELLIMCQVESVEAVANINQIAAVDGVDCIQMGPLDLSASLGYLWDPGHKKVKETLRAAEKAVLEGGAAAYLSGFAMPHDGAVELKSRGYHMVSGAVDLGLFRNAAVEDVDRFRAGLSESSGEEEESGGDRVDGKDDDEYWSE